MSSIGCSKCGMNTLVPSEGVLTCTNCQHETPIVRTLTGLELVSVEPEDRTHLYYGLGGCTASGGANSTDAWPEVTCIQCLAKFDTKISKETGS